MAIAFDAASSATTTGVTSLTYAHTCTGTDLILVVAAFCNQSFTISGVTYNGNAMTLATTSINSTDRIGLYYQLGPTTGTHNVVISISGAASGLSGNSESFTGAKQSAQPDATTTGAQSATPKTTNITVVAANSWVVIAGRDSGSGGTSPSTNCTDRGMSTAQVGMFDSGGPVAAGSFGMTMTSPSSMFTAMLSIAPSSNAFSQVITDTADVSDSFASLLIKGATILDSIDVTDVITRSISRTITDSIALTDDVTSSIGTLKTDWRLESLPIPVWEIEAHTLPTIWDPESQTLPTTWDPEAQTLPTTWDPEAQTLPTIWDLERVPAQGFVDTMPVDFIITEDGDQLITEDGDSLITEDSNTL